MKFYLLSLFAFTLFAEITFPVSEVKQTKKALEMDSASKALEEQVGFPVEDFHVDVEKMRSTPTHPVIYAAQRAFNDHRPLTLSPDTFWLLICQGVSSHINADPERMRQYLVEHDGRKLISVRRDEFVKGSKENDWPGVFPDFLKKMKKHTKGDLIDVMDANFSTSSVTDRVAFQIAIMDSFSDFFIYEAESECGIPSITLRGTPKDWQKLIEKTKNLKNYDLGWWVNSIVPLLEKIHASSKGQVDREFWQSIFKVNEESGGPYVNGWLIKFFPYILDGIKLKKNKYVELDMTKETEAYIQKRMKQRKKTREEVVKNLKGQDPWPLCGLNLSNFTQGFSRVPFYWRHQEKAYKMEFVGGFLGMSQEKDLSLQPEIAWAVREVKEISLNVPRHLKYILREKHKTWYLSIGPEDLKGVEDLRHFSTLYKLKYLTLEKCALKDEDLVHFKDIELLKDLFLVDNKLTGKGLKYFLKNKNIYQLRLDGNPLDKKSLAMMKEFLNLSHLSIKGCGLDWASVAALDKVKKLSDINGFIRGNQELSIQLYVNEKAYEYDGEERGGNLEQALKIGKEDGQLFIGKGLIKTRKDLVKISSVNEVEVLSIVNNALSDKDLKLLSGFNKLENLDLRGNKITGAGFKFLASCKSLKKLTLDQNPIEAKYLESLAALKNLEELNLRNCRLSFKEIGNLAKLHKLESIEGLLRGGEVLSIRIFSDDLDEKEELEDDEEELL